MYEAHPDDSAGPAGVQVTTAAAAALRGGASPLLHLQEGTRPVIAFAHNFCKEENKSSLMLRWSFIFSLSVLIVSLSLASLVQGSEPAGPGESQRLRQTQHAALLRGGKVR